MGEHLFCKEKVEGSSPFSSTKLWLALNLYHDREIAMKISWIRIKKHGTANHQINRDMVPCENVDRRS